jgi:hypothetical protein
MKSIFLLCSLMFVALDVFPQRNEALIKQLDSIHHNDQVYRGQLEHVQSTYGGDSKEMQALIKKTNTSDSINFIKVEAILEKYGWLGAEVIGHEGNSTLFLVIQHSPLASQQKYLPMMRDAVSKGNAEARSLALLEDRVALRLGKRQLYGSQISWDMKTNEYYVLPLEDPDNVDKRRATMGLETLSDYISRFNMKWDVEQYKKDLPSIEAKTRAKLK